MLVKQLNFEGCLSYIVACERSRSAMIIDPSHEQDPFVDYVETNGLQVSYVLDTHTHVDHISTAQELAGLFRSKTVMYEGFEKQRAIKSETPIPADIEQIIDENKKKRVDLAVTDGQTLTVGDLSFTVLFTPGHTRDAVCLVGGGRLFTGDTLLIGQCGRTDLPGGSYADMHRSLFDRLYPLSDDLVLYPAHDYRGNINSSLGYERVNNVSLKTGRTVEEFGDFLAHLFPPLNSEGGKLQCGLTMSPPSGAEAELNPLMKTFCFSMEQYLHQPHGDTLTSPQELFSALDKGEKILVLDVREPKELATTGYIKGAFNIPVTQVAERIDELPRDLNTPIVAVCESGARSGHAALYLRAYGYSNVRNLEYGMRGWRTEGYPLAYP